MLNRYNPLHMFLASYGNELNRIDYRILKESRNSSSPSSFSYNGLVYSFNPDLNMFVNQFGHAMDYAQAVALAASLGYSEQEFEGLADSTDTDGGGDRRSAPAPVSIPNKIVYSYGVAPYGYVFGISWPTQYNDTKGLTFYYPYVGYYPAFLGPQRSLIENRTFSMVNDSVNEFGWTGHGTLVDNYYNFAFDVDYLRQPNVPANFNFGATAHGITLYADQIIGAYSWIPPENREFHSSKSWSAFNTVSGIPGAEYNLSRFNYLTQGNSFTNWTFTGGATFVNVVGLTGPNGVTSGTLKGHRINFPGASTPKIARSVTLPTAGWTYTASVFMQGLTANDLVTLNVVGASGASFLGTKVLGTTWGRYQVVFGAQNPGTVTFEISGSTGAAGQWASAFNIWGAQVEQANGVKGDGFRTVSERADAAYRDSPSYYIDTGATPASTIAGSGQKSFWLARKAQYVEKELRNLFSYMLSRGFTMGTLTFDDEGYYQFFTEAQNSLLDAYVWEYNTLYQNESAGGNTWFINQTGICAQPKCMLERTSRFGQQGVTNFKDLLLLRGFTTNPSATGFINDLNYRAFTNKNAISSSDPRAFLGNVFNQAMQEMISYFIEDSVMNPFREMMLGNSADTTAVMSNYGYVDNYVAFVGNTYTDSQGNAIVAGTTNFALPNIKTLFDAVGSDSLVTSKTIIDSFFRFEGDNSYSTRTLSYNKSGNYSSPSAYGTWQSGAPGYGNYWYDSQQYPSTGGLPGASNLTGNMGARQVFDWQNASRPLNYYGYTGSTWANAGQAAYTIAGFATGRTRAKQVHVPGIWRGITMAGGAGQTFTCSFCFDSNSATYTGVSAGFGVTCLGCNDQQTYTVDYFMNSLWGITQATESLAPVGIIPASIRAAQRGYRQGQLTQEWARDAGGASPVSYFTPCGTPIPGVTLLPGTIYRDYETHWYWMGWLGFMSDLGQHRESATTRVYEAIEKRNRLGDASIPQDPYTVWVHAPGYCLQGILNTWVNGPQYDYRHDITSYSYFRPLGVTYDLITWYFNDTGSYQNKGATVYYGDINHYWAENIRHAFLHKTIAIDQWGAGTYVSTVSPGRTTQTYRYNSPWEKGSWQRSAGDVRGKIDNPDEIRSMLGNDKVFTPPVGPNTFPGASGCTLGGVCAPMAYKLGGQRINTLVAECNDQAGGMVHETMYLAPINWAEKEYAISGAQLTNGTYLWRITFLNKATQPIYVKGSRYGDVTGVTYNIAGVTNFIDNPNHEKGIWWACTAYELPIVTNPPVTPNNGLPPGTTTWNGIDGVGSPGFPTGIANTSILF